MQTAPGAAPPTEHSPDVRPGCLVGVLLVVLGFAVSVVLLTLLPEGDREIMLGHVEDYEPGSVVYLSTARLFVVRRLDGSVIALSDLDPHSSPEEGCRVTFRPDLAEEGEPGRFFDACTGSLYESSGRGRAGDGLDLQPIALERDDDGRLRVVDKAAIR